jgi:preprotein translocase subunit SecE
MATSDTSPQANRSGLDPRRLVVMFYLVTGIVLALFFGHVAGMLFAQLGVSDPEVVEGLGWNVSSLLGVALALGTGLGCYLHPMVRSVSLECASELMKVTWPSWGETRVSTVAVVVASLISAVILFGIDTVAYKLMVDWIPSLWGKL